MTTITGNPRYDRWVAIVELLIAGTVAPLDKKGACLEIAYSGVAVPGQVGNSLISQVDRHRLSGDAPDFAPLAGMAKEFIEWSVFNCPKPSWVSQAGL